MNLGVLRPNTIEIQRRTTTNQSPTGEYQIGAPATLNTGVPALVDHAQTGNNQFMVEGQIYVQEATLFLDGLNTAQFAGVQPGGTIVINGISYLVAANGLGAFPDLLENDKIIDETGTSYLVIAVMPYFDVLPSLEAALSESRSW